MNLSKKMSPLLNVSKGWLAPVASIISESKGVQILGGVLVLQLGLAGGLLWKSGLQAGFAPMAQLVSIDPAIVDEVIIDNGNERLTLVSIDDQWRMDDEHESLVASEKVDQLLSGFTELQPGLPVASTVASHQQLEVAEDAFQRRVTLKSDGDAVADLYLGTSPGFRKSHMRRVDQDQVYAVKMAIFDVPSEHDGWLDENLLAFDNINSIRSGDTELAIVDEQWIIVDPQDQSDTHDVDQTAIDLIVNRLTSLRVNGFATPLENDEPAEVKADNSESDVSEELLSHSIEIVQNDAPVTLVLSRKGSNATIERSDVKGLFALPVDTYNVLTADSIRQVIVERVAEARADEDLPQG